MGKMDLSRDKEKRGAIVTGYYYWYSHPQSRSGIIFRLRTDLPPHQCGPEASELECVWYLTHDCPERVRLAAERELDGQW